MESATARKTGLLAPRRGTSSSAAHRPALLAGLLALVASWPLAAEAQRRPGWVLLGEARLAPGARHEVVQLDSWGRGPVQGIRLQVQDGGLALGELRLTFGDGRRQVVPIRRFIPPGGSTRVIDLPGRGQHLRSVELVSQGRRGGWRRGGFGAGYGPAAHVGPAVAVYGRLAPYGWGPRGIDRPGSRERQARWQVLGSGTVGPRLHRELVPVDWLEGTLGGLVVRVDRGSVELRSLAVVTDDGLRHALPVRAILHGGRSTPELALPGAARRVRYVELLYRAAAGPSGRAEVSVLGLRLAEHAPWSPDRGWGLAPDGYSGRDSWGRRPGWVAPPTSADRFGPRGERRIGPPRSY